MLSFLVGLIVIAVFAIASLLGFLLFPIFVLLGFFVRILVGFALIIFMIWLIGKVTLLSIDYYRRRIQEKKEGDVPGPPAGVS